MKRILLFPLLLISQFIVLAQKDCRNAEYRQQQINNSPALIARINAIEAFTKDLQRSRTIATNDINSQSNTPAPAPQVIVIPVVVHVLYNNNAQNISNAQILSQIDVLNKDYARQNADTNNTPVVFRPFAANCGIRFELAKVDSAGYATTGVVRKHTNIAGFAIDDRIKFSNMGGDDAWDRDRYLNLWVGNLSGGVIGYASVVGGQAERDGVVILYSAFGAGGSAKAPFNKGRTATHEIGHWLNLIHTWGDADCGTDQVDDTPPQQGPDRGYITGVKVSCNNGPNGDMYTNFMDFTDDNCMNLFTNGQRDRMQALFAPGGERYAMLSSNALTSTPLDTPVILSVPPDNIPGQQVSVYPNPATSLISVQISDDANLGSTLEIYNQVGQKVITSKVTQLLFQLNVSALTKGIYYIKVGNGKNGGMSKLVKM